MKCKEEEGYLKNSFPVLASKTTLIGHPPRTDNHPSPKDKAKVLPILKDGCDTGGKTEKKMKDED